MPLQEKEGRGKSRAGAWKAVPAVIRSSGDRGRDGKINSLSRALHDVSFTDDRKKPASAKKGKNKASKIQDFVKCM